MELGVEDISLLSAGVLYATNGCHKPRFLRDRLR